MSHVSDRASFADTVAKEGALPFLALGLMRNPELKDLLEETQHLLGDYPWGADVQG